MSDKAETEVSKTIDLVISVPVVKCMGDRQEDGSKKRHMHMQVYPSEVSVNGKDVGGFGVDTANSVVFSFGHENYHIAGVDLWNAVRNALNIKIEGE